MTIIVSAATAAAAAEQQVGPIVTKGLDKPATWAINAVPAGFDVACGIFCPNWIG
jgi:hypothetical protein